jgi:hypothetical protein
VQLSDEDVATFVLACFCKLPDHNLVIPNNAFGSSFVVRALEIQHLS